MKNFKIHPTPGFFSASITLPGDKSISHRVAILAALAKGSSTLTGFLESEDTEATLRILQQLGTKIERPAAGVITIHGRNGVFKKPTEALFCGNSGTTMRLFAGILAAQPFSTHLTGDASLSTRPMNRIIEPLRLMGALIQSKEEKGTPPLFIRQSMSLCPINYELPIASAQVKTALLFAALFATGKTSITEPSRCRNHTECLFESFQIKSTSMAVNSDGKRTITVTGPQLPKSCDFLVPGDISSAAFWIVAAAARPGSFLKVKNVGLNPTRTGFLTVLKRMGANIEIKQRGHQRGQSHKLQDLGSDPKIHELALNSTIYGTDPFDDPFDSFDINAGELTGDIIIHGSQLKGTTMEGKEIPGLIDELPILAIAGALACGTTIIRDAHELRVKETDRITAITSNLRSMGVGIKENNDGLEIQGNTPLKGALLKSYGDHRIAMAFSIAALFAQGTSFIDDINCSGTSYPGFIETFQSLILHAGHRITK